MTLHSLPDNQEDREVYLREHHTAEFIKAVVKARDDKLDFVTMTYTGFAGEPDVFYVAMAYAYNEGVAVLLVGTPDN